MGLVAFFIFLLLVGEGQLEHFVQAAALVLRREDHRRACVGGRAAEVAQTHVTHAVLLLANQFPDELVQGLWVNVRLARQQLFAGVFYPHVFSQELVFAQDL